jgi:hypothetical protein
MSSNAKGGAFFRTMVIMGSSVALGCGGLTQSAGSGGGTGSGGSPGDGGNAGGSGGTGSGGRGSGGSGGVATGGQLASGGSIILLPPDTGGSGGASLGMGGAYPTDCTTAQLTCTWPDWRDCSNSGSFLVLPANCECDFERPSTADDCGIDETCVCDGASEDALGRTFDPLAPFNCACQPNVPSGSCYDYCESGSSGTTVLCSGPDELDLEAYLCGCAYVLLK